MFQVQFEERFVVWGGGAALLDHNTKSRIEECKDVIYVNFTN